MVNKRIINLTYELKPTLVIYSCFDCVYSVIQICKKGFALFFLFGATKRTFNINCHRFSNGFTKDFDLSNKIQLENKIKFRKLRYSIGIFGKKFEIARKLRISTLASSTGL